MYISRLKNKIQFAKKSKLNSTQLIGLKLNKKYFVEDQKIVEKISKEYLK